MFEYTALVDAPVRRFTGIVTGGDADDEPVARAVSARTRSVPAVLGAADARTIDVSLVRIVESPVPNEPSAPTLPALRATTPTAAAAAGRAAPPAVGPALVPRTDRAASPMPSLVPALIGIALAGITAMWWMRR